MNNSILEFIKKTNKKDLYGSYLSEYKCKCCGKKILKKPSVAKK